MINVDKIKPPVPRLKENGDLGRAVIGRGIQGTLEGHSGQRLILKVTDEEKAKHGLLSNYAFINADECEWI